MKAGTRQYRKRSKFLVLGHTASPEKRYQKCNIVVRPSSQNDPWGRDVIETMALGRVVVATGGHSDFIDNYEDGFLIGNWDEIKVATIIEHLINTPNEYLRVCKNAHVKASSLFDPNKSATNFSKLLDRICKRDWTLDACAGNSWAECKFTRST